MFNNRHTTSYQKTAMLSPMGGSGRPPMAQSRGVTTTPTGIWHARTLDMLSARATRRAERVTWVQEAVSGAKPKNASPEPVQAE